jgi:hypothetical protein
VDSDILAEAPKWPYDKVVSGKPGSFFQTDNQVAYMKRQRSANDAKQQHVDFLNREKFIDEKRKFPGQWRHILADKRRDNRTLTIHLVPTSQTLLGFKKTVDEYYSGTNQMVDHASVRSILSTVTDELSKDPKRRFSFAEVKYLQMWYTRQKPEIKEKFKKLVQNGQFEIVNGGWSSFDEACPSYE